MGVDRGLIPCIIRVERNETQTKERNQMKNKTHEIGDTIKITFQDKTSTKVKITGRNWWGENLVSYIIRHNYNDYTVDPENLHIQQSWGTA